MIHTYVISAGLQGSPATVFTAVIDEEFPADMGIVYHAESADLLPGNVELSAAEAKVLQMTNYMVRIIRTTAISNEISPNS